VRAIIILLSTVVSVSQASAATPMKSANSAPAAINIRTAGDLAAACTIKPASRTDFARLNFCNGFAQGVLQTNQQNPSGTKVCIPNPSPKRSETMVAFAGWVRADVSRKDDLASVAFLQFMAGRFPCP
jgi:Rap1a immunity proteins